MCSINQLLNDVSKVDFQFAEWMRDLCGCNNHMLIRNENWFELFSIDRINYISPDCQRQTTIQGTYSSSIGIWFICCIHIENLWNAAQLKGLSMQKELMNWKRKDALST